MVRHGHFQGPERAPDRTASGLRQAPLIQRVLEGRHQLPEQVNLIHVLLERPRRPRVGRVLDDFARV